MDILKISAVEENKVEVLVNALSPVSSNHALVKGIFSGISHGTELAVVQGTTPTFYKHWDDELRCFSEGDPSKKYPSNLGYEYVGEVVEIGAKVTELKKGDIVWMDASHRSFNLLEIGKTPYVKIDGREHARKAVFLALTRVALAGVHDAEPKIGDVAFVSGLGTIGLIKSQKVNHRFER
jgi:threonine dehydrogenase-like Zn-dependent dehydrogenase